MNSINIQHRYSAATALLMDITNKYPSSTKLPEFLQVHQRQMDISRQIAKNNSPLGLIELYIKAVIELDDCINSMTKEERERLCEIEDFFDVE